MRTKMLRAIGIIATVAVLFSAQSLTAFARSRFDWIKNMTEEEIIEYICDSSDFKDTSEIGKLTASIAYYDVKQFVSNYEPVSDFVKIGEVAEDFWNNYDDGKSYEDYFYAHYFNAYLLNDDGSIYTCIAGDPDNDYYTLSYNESTDTFVCVTKNGREIDDGEEIVPAEVSLWTYDEDSDMYVCTDESGKITATYAKYHFPDEETVSETTSSSKADSSESSSVTSQSEGLAAGSPESAGDSAAEAGTEVNVYDEEVSAATSMSESTSMSIAQIIILSIVGTLVFVGIVVIIILLVKKNKSDKTETVSKKEES